MKIVAMNRLTFPEVAVIRFARFKDHRGYFKEQYRESDFEGLDGLRGVDFRQMNESFSRAGTIRGLHIPVESVSGEAGSRGDRPADRPRAGYPQGLADVRADHCP
jgi:dTDP-4-dehydrorhamnose 3,5-epimerase-like enzyme